MSEQRWHLLFAALSALGGVSGLAVGTLQVLVWLKKGELPVGALWLSAFLIGLFAISVWAQYRYRSARSGVKSALDPHIVDEVGRLNPYQTFAVRQLVATGGMTGLQFALRLAEWGVPIDNRGTQNAVAEVFDGINRETTLLTHDGGVWKLRDREGVRAALK